MAGTSCDSCGRDARSLTTVRRVYLTPSAGEHPVVEEVLEARERWCEACVAQYPCRPG